MIISVIHCHSRWRPFSTLTRGPVLSFCVCQLSGMSQALHSLTHTQTQHPCYYSRIKQAHNLAKSSASNIPASSVWLDTVTESKSPHDEHHPKKFQIRSVTKLSAWLTRVINSRACTAGQSCLFMKWTAKGPSWLWYCETEKEREHNITILDQKYNPVISLS